MFVCQPSEELEGPGWTELIRRCRRHTCDVDKEAGRSIQTLDERRAARETPGELRGRRKNFAELRSLPFSGNMWARAVVCAALLSALCPAGRTEAERDERDVQDYSYSNSNRLVRLLRAS